MNLKNKIFTLLLVLIVLLSVSNVLGAAAGGGCTCNCIGDFRDPTPNMYGCSCGYYERLTNDNCRGSFSCTCTCNAIEDSDYDSEYCTDCADYGDRTSGDRGIGYSYYYFDHSSNSGSASCCGDDSGEWWWGSACCDSYTDCEYSGVCYNYGTFRSSGAYKCIGHDIWLDNTVDPVSATSGACICGEVCSSDYSKYYCTNGDPQEWVVLDEACTITNMGDPSCSSGGDCYCPSCTSNQCQVGSLCLTGSEISDKTTCEDTCGGEWIYKDISGDIELSCCYGDGRYPRSCSTDSTLSSCAQTDTICSSRYWLR